MTRHAAYPIKPPRERGTLRALALAALMHVLLALFLYFGVHWQNSTPVGAEAELWTEADVPPPAPAASPAPPPVPAPAPVQPAPPPARDDEADIALQQKKQQQLEAQRQAQQLAEQERQRQQAEQQAQAQRQQQLAAQRAAQKAAAEKLKQQAQAEKLRQQQLAQQQALAARQSEELKEAQQLKDQQERQQKLAEDKKQQQLKAQKDQEAKEAKARQAAEQQQAAKAKLDQERHTRLAQLQGLAGDSPVGNGLAKSGTGSGSGGNASSAGYQDKVQRAVRPNIVYSGDLDDSTAVIRVRCAPSGTVLSATLARSSGNSAWDAAALHAVEKTGTMPPDNDGKTPTSFTITMKPRN